MSQYLRDFPDPEVLGDAGGAGTTLFPVPSGGDKKELQTHQSDVSMGTSMGDAACYASAESVTGTSVPAPYSTATAENVGVGRPGTSPVLPAAPFSVLSQPSASTQIVELPKFTRRPAAIILL